SRWGVNRHVRGLAKALEERGHEVSIIAPAEERNTARTARQRARLARRVARDSARTGASMYVPSAEEDNEPGRLFKISGTFRLPYSESIANLALPKDVTDHLNELLAREDFDILHLHEPYPPNLSFTALRLARCPVVATFHTAGERFLSFQLLRPVVERFFSRLDGRICTSQNTRRIVSGHFPGGYQVIGSGVDTGLFRPREDNGAAMPAPLVMYAAWGEPRKALALLFRSMRLLPDDLPPFQLAMVAGEPLLRSGRMSIPRRLRDRVTFTGYASGKELPGFYGRSEILCAPYATPAQATAALEAMAAANAMILPGQGGIRELVREGSEGILLDHPYSYNLAASLIDLLDDRSLRLSLGHSAVSRARDLSWDGISAQVEDAYSKAYRRRRHPAAHKAIEATDRCDTILADLHTHTSHSPDCAVRPEQLLEACEECGIEAVAITDHNTISGALETAAIAPEGMHVIVGEEIKTVSGEIIGLYLKEEIPKGLTAEETIARIKQQGGLVYIPHPFDPLHMTPTYEMLARNAADIDIIEVYNPRITFTSFNEKARRLARKYGIPGGAGSDCHVVEGVGTAMLSLNRFNGPLELLASLRRADIIRSNKSPLYLHSMKLLKNSRSSVESKI
ncbi:MAG TPA: glycosyltransferase, partial [Actinobacteria bacterium]|nr:glycosyltransferase [Actinomycetota bacterium]